MKRLFLILSTVAMVLISSQAAFGAKKITVHVIPEEATISRDGMEVATGTYTVEFSKGIEFVTLKLECPGYEERRVTVRKDNPKKDLMFKLSEDEAMANSIGSESGEVANKWFDITCKKGMDEDAIWKRLISIAVDNFDELEVRDKAAGWIKSKWAVTRFKKTDVRTRLEIRATFSDDGTPTYKVRLISEKKDSKDGPQAYRKYPRLLKKYENVITELQTVVGSNL